MDFVDRDKNMMPDLHNLSELSVAMNIQNLDEFWNGTGIDDSDQAPFSLSNSPLKMRIEGYLDNDEDMSNILKGSGVDRNQVIQSVEVGVDNSKNTPELMDCGEISKAKEKDGSTKEILECGDCAFNKVEDKYQHDYMVDLYGNLVCCNSNCKQGKKSMVQLISKGNGNCIWVCKNCEKKDDGHNCEKMFCNICYCKKMEKESGSGRRKRGRY